VCVKHAFKITPATATSLQLLDFCVASADCDALETLICHRSGTDSQQISHFSVITNNL
jgi:hypothetical protein